jgi:Zn-dependent peptidase ImmA (M78 family)/DNA-binding Xre family transcriptional regulator
MRIRRLREAAGLQAQDLAVRVGLDPTAVSKIETGKRAIKAAELARIAEALKVSPLALLEEDSLVSKLPIAARRAGATVVRGKAYERLLSLSELHVVLAGAGIHTTPYLASVPDVAGLSWLEGAKVLARWASEALSLDLVGDQRLNALATAIEDRLNIDVFVESYPDDALCGAAITDRAFPLIFVNGYFPLPRALFTLAHELAHVLAGHAEDPITLDQELSGSNDPERMANAFAAFYLMPEDIICAEFDGPRRTVSTLASLAYKLGVSYESLIYRLHNLKLINAEGRDKLRAVSWQALTAQVDSPTLSTDLTRVEVARMRSRGGKRPDRRAPAVLLRRAWDGQRKGVLSVRPLAALMGVEPEELLDQIGETDDFNAMIKELNANNYSATDDTETAEELFGGPPV